MLRSVDVKIAPFRGYRHGAGGERDVTAVVAPPYDQIGHDTQGQLLAMSPHNIVRVTLPAEEPGADRYRQAGEILDRWIAGGVWAREQSAAIYPYEQTYTV